MKCPRCGTDITEQDWRHEVGTNKILIITSIIIVILILLVAGLAIRILNEPDSVLTGVFGFSHVNGDDEDGDYTLAITGYVYNKGPMGCFANLTFILSDDRGWSTEVSVDRGWIPANAYASSQTYVYEDFEYPVKFNKVEVNWPVPLYTLHFEFEYDLYDPILDV